MQSREWQNVNTFKMALILLSLLSIVYRCSTEPVELVISRTIPPKESINFGGDDGTTNPSSSWSTQELGTKFDNANIKQSSEDPSSSWSTQELGTKFDNANIKQSSEDYTFTSRSTALTSELEKSMDASESTTPLDIFDNNDTSSGTRSSNLSHSDLVLIFASVIYCTRELMGF